MKELNKLFFQKLKEKNLSKTEETAFLMDVFRSQ